MRGWLKMITSWFTPCWFLCTECVARGKTGHWITCSYVAIGNIAKNMWIRCMVLEHCNKRQVCAPSFAYWMLSHFFSYCVSITASMMICSQFFSLPTENVTNSKPHIYLANPTSVLHLNNGATGRAANCTKGKMWCLCPCFITVFSSFLFQNHVSLNIFYIQPWNCKARNTSCSNSH